MKKNMTIPDRAIRLILAVALGILALTRVVTGVTGTVFLIIAIVFALTALVNYCPLYRILGIRRWEKKQL